MLRYIAPGLAVLAFGLLACPDRREAQPPRRSDAGPPALPDAGNRVSASPTPTPQPRRLDARCTCEPPAAAGPPANTARRKAFARQMDAAHAAIADLMRALLPPAPGPARPVPDAPMRRARRAPETRPGAPRRSAGRMPPRPRAVSAAAWQRARCLLDCLLDSFPEVSAPALAWQRALAQFLETARSAASRGPHAPPLPTATQDRLIARYNAVAHASNGILGLPLLRAPPPAPRALALDALSFSAHARRLLAATDALLRRAGLHAGTRQDAPPAPAQRPAPAGAATESANRPPEAWRAAACAAPLAARVRHAALLRALRSQVRACSALTCRQRPTCRATDEAWRTYCTSLHAVAEALSAGNADLRDLDAALGTPQAAPHCRRVLGKLSAALTAYRRARAAVAAQITALRRASLPRPRRRPPPR